MPLCLRRTYFFPPLTTFSALLSSALCGHGSRNTCICSAVSAVWEEEFRFQYNFIYVTTEEWKESHFCSSNRTNWKKKKITSPMWIIEQHWRYLWRMCVLNIISERFLSCWKSRCTPRLIFLEWEEVMSRCPSRFNVTAFTFRAPALWAWPLTWLITRDFPSAAAGWAPAGFIRELSGMCCFSVLPPQRTELQDQLRRGRWSLRR